jgi:hypothetical protein
MALVNIRSQWNDSSPPHVDDSLSTIVLVYLEGTIDLVHGNVSDSGDVEAFDVVLVSRFAMEVW